MTLLRIRHSVVEISRNCLTLARTLLNLPLEMRWKRVGSAGAMVVATALCGCAGMTSSEAPEVIVKQRAQDRWNAMIAGDLTKAYSYMSPASRTSISPELFRNSVRPGFWKSAEVESAQCVKDACDVVVQVTYQSRGSSIRTPVKETWVNSEGGWWHVFKPV